MAVFSAPMILTNNSASISKKFWGGHRPKNGPKRPHFRGEIRKMCRFCLILEILGGARAPPAPPLMEALIIIEK